MPSLFINVPYNPGLQNLFVLEQFIYQVMKYTCEDIKSSEITRVPHTVTLWALIVNLKVLVDSLNSKSELGIGNFVIQSRCYLGLRASIRRYLLSGTYVCFLFILSEQVAVHTKVININIHRFQHKRCEVSTLPICIEFRFLITLIAIMISVNTLSMLLTYYWDWGRITVMIYFTLGDCGSSILSSTPLFPKP